jgi:hypothetical protein
VSKRLVLGLVTLVGVVLAGTGLWFTSHLGPEGSATFTARPGSDRLVVLEPSVLNRVDSDVTVTARGEDGARLWIGRATPSDAQALVGDAARQSVSGVSVTDWALTTESAGGEQAPTLAGADVWREAATGEGRATLRVTQADAPETVVIGTPSGQPADLTEVSVTWQRTAWSLQALGLLAVGGLMAAAGVAGLLLPRLRPALADLQPGTGGTRAERRAAREREGGGWGRRAAADRHTAPVRDEAAAPGDVPPPDRREHTAVLPLASAGGGEPTVPLRRPQPPTTEQPMTDRPADREESA